VHIVNREGRWQTEKAACDRLWRKLNVIREFDYTESAVDHSGHTRIPFDMAIIAFEAGVVARTGDGVDSEPFTHWTIGTHKSEGHYVRRFDLYEPMVSAVCFPEDYPRFEMGKVVTKEAEIEYLARLGALNDCWYCRKPKAGKPCAKCEACDEVRRARRTLTKRQPKNRQKNVGH
jgi:hypothetical protein